MEKPIKLAVVVPSSLPIPSVKGGAIETLMDTLILENEKQGCLELTVYCQKNREAKEQAKILRNTKVVYLNGEGFCARVFSFIRNLKNRKGQNYFTSYFLYKACKKIKKQTVEAVVIEGTHAVSEAVKHYTKKKTILHLHNEFNPTTPRAKEKAKCIDAYLTVSDYIKEQACLVEGVEEDAVFTVHNCTNHNKFNKDLYISEGKAIRQKYNLAENDVLVLFSGRITPEKGVLELTKAILRLPDNIKLLILGKPSFEDGKETEYSKTINELATQSNGKVIVSGFIPYKDIPYYHAACDIAVVPSTWNEPAALVVFEALASGLPLIISHSGGMIEYANENCAIIVPRDKNVLTEELMVAIQMLANDENKRNIMAKSGRDFIKKFDTGNYYREYVEGINKCINK